MFAAYRQMTRDPAALRRHRARLRIDRPAGNSGGGNTGLGTAAAWRYCPAAIPRARDLRSCAEKRKAANTLRHGGSIPVVWLETIYSPSSSSSWSRPSRCAFNRSSLRLARSAARFTSSEPTSSIIACSAPSPLRGPMRTMRV